MKISDEKKYYKVAINFDGYGSKDDAILCEEHDLEDTKELVLDDFIDDCNDQGWSYHYPSGFENDDEENDDEETPIDMKKIEREIEELEISYEEYLKKSKTIRHFDTKTKTAIY